MTLGPDDKTPVNRRGPQIVGEQERLGVSVVTRAHEAGKLAGAIECRASCDVIRRRYDRGVLVGAAVALAGLVAGFGAWWLWP